MGIETNTRTQQLSNDMKPLGIHQTIFSLGITIKQHLFSCTKIDGSVVRLHMYAETDLLWYFAEINLTMEPRRTQL